MDFEDRIAVPTPEGIDVELVVGGRGWRVVAGRIDAKIQGVVVVSLSLVTLVGVGASGDFGGFAAAVFAVGYFLILFGYHPLFETLMSGRTPGKRVAGLRVVRSGGEPPGFMAVAIRNLLRLVDFLPAFYLLGATFVLFSSRHQRLGDFAAGTLVVRERRAPPPSPAAGWGHVGFGSMSPQAADALAAWDVSGITLTETATVRRFLERRFQLEGAARARLAGDLASHLRPRVPGAPPHWAAEDFLEGLAAAKAARS